MDNILVIEEDVVQPLVQEILVVVNTHQIGIFVRIVTFRIGTEGERWIYPLLVSVHVEKVIDCLYQVIDSLLLVGVEINRIDSVIVIGQKSGSVEDILVHEKNEDDIVNYLIKILKGKGIRDEG